jgi:hypothetical protein
MPQKRSAPLAGNRPSSYIQPSSMTSFAQRNVLGLTLREEHKLRVFENRVQTRIFGPKRDGVTGGWRKLHNEELHDLYSSPSIIRIMKSRRMRWAGHVARMGEKRNVYGLLVRKPEGKRPLGRAGHGCLVNVDGSQSDVDWICVAQHSDQWKGLQ